MLCGAEPSSTLKVAMKDLEFSCKFYNIIYLDAITYSNIYISRSVYNCLSTLLPSFFISRANMLVPGTGYKAS